MRCAIVGGGAAGFFLALNLKEQCPEMEVTIFERSQHVLQKVAISGGGRCNCTNTFEGVSDLSRVYPRGHRLLKRLFKAFGPEEAYAWFEQRGVSLVRQADACVFPASQDSYTIINCFVSEARRLGVTIQTGKRITSLEELSDYDFIAVTTGGSPRMEGLQWLTEKGIAVEPPVPSLFTFRINDPQLQALMGTVAEEATAMIPGTKLRATGPLLVTHWGMSGPAILKLSSHAARLLSEHSYHLPLAVNWVSRPEDEVRQQLLTICSGSAQKQLTSVRPFGLSTRLWTYLLDKSLGQRAQAPWMSLNKKELNRLVTVLTADSYEVAGRAAFKDEFVTCGGVSLSAVHPSTLECRTVPHLYFAGEILDIDGVTGGFNFQAAWTTAYTVAQAICEATRQRTV
ncbi:MAG: aminoacetone oxidase family FAD-binding enzyme [Prevotella sp.]|nr:aminoacetone oxidase family FAD-binding enzyme [Prevotella sp.]